MAKIYKRGFTAEYYIVRIPHITIDLTDEAIYESMSDEPWESDAEYKWHFNQNKDEIAGELKKAMRSKEDSEVRGSFGFVMELEDVDWQWDFEGPRAKMTVSGVAETDEPDVAKSKDDWGEYIDLSIKDYLSPMKVELREISLGAGKKPKVYANPQDATVKRMMNPRNY